MTEAQVDYVCEQLRQTMKAQVAVRRPTDAELVGA
jgi:hypothetical protein